MSETENMTTSDKLRNIIVGVALNSLPLPNTHRSPGTGAMLMEDLKDRKVA